MCEVNLQAGQRRRYQVTTSSSHKQPVFDHRLQREFDVAPLNRVYAADVTCICRREGWLYLVLVIDLCSPKIIGWSISSRMKVQLVCDALQVATWRRQPKVGSIHHSDRGSQSAGKAFRRRLQAHGIRGCLKQEPVHWRSYPTRYKVQQDILESISMFYHRRRRHSYLGYMSPNDFEPRLTGNEKAA